MAVRSPFLTPGPRAKVNDLAVLHLKRDLQIPVLLRASDEHDEGYAEGKVTNTRFGSFPHSTLLGLPWGSQVRASAVDTGSRGRRQKDEPLATIQGQKRKRVETAGNDHANAGDVHGQTAPTIAITAPTGFAHLLPPTPENWTTSLPHRTQVVYTPDYSYILQRLRVRPGSVVIEAGAGSGSFTHAAARAVFNGYPQVGLDSDVEPNCRGKVWSFEFHEQRVEMLRAEIHEHKLDHIVEITHRDVCTDGFSVFTGGAQVVQGDAVFLDLPAPWLALKHLARISSTVPNTSSDPEPCGVSEPVENIHADSVAPHLRPLALNASPLAPHLPVRICTFSPCIEQVQATHQALRSMSYTEIETVELSAKRLEVRRERVSLVEEGQRRVNASPTNVAEAVGRLRDIEARMKAFHNGEEDQTSGQQGEDDGRGERAAVGEAIPCITSKQHRVRSLQDRQTSRKLYKEGRLVHCPEPELKTHTSYLTFAILPREWTAEDEAKAQEKWKNGGEEKAGQRRWLSRRKEKRAMKIAEGGGKQAIEKAALENGAKEETGVNEV